ncbi:DUF922 domain-containing protein [Hymenobacter busanensis]|uniref:DUF922 domain-containing protein n=1 Tax=Hymenobacter busanensis TaxID=2607656 RepID=A0A7L4ZUE0_9BACT|nr:DUF922 domain-containing protein [Hymenobacter busanensis]KAA9327127.1 DUF922 domain-containing protein [Hymenobacter busanensis]QHJ05792.1 DUF922 domain-containing protein [Hymenobacter busanensis]
MQSLLLIFLLPLLTAVQPPQTTPATKAEPELLVWSARRPLTWADFKAKPAAGDPLHALTTANIGAKVGCQDFVFSSTVQATFTPSQSWVKAPQTASAALLRHEQTHFDLTEVYARRMRQRLKATTFDCEHLQPAFNNLMKLTISEWQREQQRYDVESNHGLNQVQQLAWEKKVQTRLGELQAFALAEPAD